MGQGIAGCVPDEAHAASDRHATTARMVELMLDMMAGSEASEDEQAPGAEGIGRGRAHRQRIVRVDTGAQYAPERNAVSRELRGSARIHQQLCRGIPLQRQVTHFLPLGALEEGEGVGVEGGWNAIPVDVGRKWRAVNADEQVAADDVGRCSRAGGLVPLEAAGEPQYAARRDTEQERAAGAAAGKDLTKSLHGLPEREVMRCGEGEAE